MFPPAMMPMIQLHQFMQKILTQEGKMANSPEDVVILSYFYKIV